MMKHTFTGEFSNKWTKIVVVWETASSLSQREILLASDWLWFLTFQLKRTEIPHKKKELDDQHGNIHINCNLEKYCRWIYREIAMNIQRNCHAFNAFKGVKTEIWLKEGLQGPESRKGSNNSCSQTQNYFPLETLWQDARVTYSDVRTCAPHGQTGALFSF